MIDKLKIKNLKLKIIFSFFIFHFSFFIFAYAQEQLSSTELVKKAWDAQGKRQYEEVFKYTNECIRLYEQEAKEQQASLTDFPPAKEMGRYSALNDVAVCLFIQGEAYMRQGKTPQAKEKFRKVIEEYSFAQAWDPRGWYWKVAEKSRDSLRKIDEGVISPIEEPVEFLPKSQLVLNSPGTEAIVNYEKYGEFIGRGTQDYRYRITDQEGLSQAVGEGIFPNTTGVRWDPEYRRLKQEGRLKGNHWEFIYTDDLAANFYKWATAPEPEGIKLFYTALALERAGYVTEAIKAYYAILVHFPKTVGWTYWNTPWYIAPAALANIEFLTRRHPELKMKLVEAKIQVINGFDNDISNDIFIVDPGKIIRWGWWKELKLKVKNLKLKIKKPEVKRVIGEGKVKLVQYANGHWQLLVQGRPYIIKGITYAPTRIGQSPDDGTLRSWMEYDYNKNGLIDGPYDAWVDKNRNNRQDPDEKSVGDFELLRQMGVNTIRIYHQPFKIEKRLLRELYERFGIMVIMGDFLGKYTLGSGAQWLEGTDYNNPQHKERMLNSVRRMVEEFKDEPYILFWLLGNENNYGVGCNADKDPESFYKFLNEAAGLIKSLDREHPVAVANGDTLYLGYFAKFCKDVDIFGANAYRGRAGFGSLWSSVKFAADKPVFITEFGCPAFALGKSLNEAEELQADYHLGNWEDINYNMAFEEGAGNALGGIIFEWLDEWWKAYEPTVHDTQGLFRGPFPDGFMHEEWLGLAGQGNGQHSPFLRQLRKAYFVYKDLWR
jgi:beta-glucuronidase